MPDNANAYEIYLPVLDVNDGLKRIMNNKKLYLSLLGRFKARQMVEELIEQINLNDPVMVAQKAHAVKGAAGNLGLPALREVTKQIETRGKAGENCTDSLTSLNDALEDVERVLAELFKNEGV